MGKTININNLSKEEINSFYDFVCDYELNIKNKYGNYNLNDTKLIAFCATNHIALKNKRSKLPYLFWFSTHQDKRTKINDKAHHLMRHIRNAFAHGLIKKEGKNYNRGIQMYRFPNSDVQKSVIFEGIKKRLKIV